MVKCLIVLVTTPGLSSCLSGVALSVCVSVAVAALSWASVAGGAAHHYLRASAVLHIILGFPHCSYQMVLSGTLVANTQAQFISTLCPHVVLCINASPSILPSLLACWLKQAATCLPAHSPPPFLAHLP